MLTKEKIKTLTDKGYSADEVHAVENWVEFCHDMIWWDSDVRDILVEALRNLIAHA